jgi:lysyl-tRNA synthetase class 2
MSNWQPSASLATLKQRAKYIQAIRHFFEQRDVLEVETPSLSQATVTDVHLDAFSTEFNFDISGQSKSLYLQTSPEYAMKRLLAAGIGSIFQLSKAFRNEGKGRFHNPEFTMLEWYRPGFDQFQLMAEVSDLVSLLLNTEQSEQLTYQQAFIDHLGVDPLNANLAQLKSCVNEHELEGEWLENEQSLDTLLQFLFSMLIEPKLGQERPCFIYHFPASQASLAKISAENSLVAERFELYYQGVELANGFNELTDAKEQRSRFIKDNLLRQANNKPTKAIDENLLSALEFGLPDCSGVALGVDRLLMLALKASNISDVLAFDVSRA